MAEEHLRKQMAVEVIGGRKRLVFNGRTVQSKAEVAARIALLDEQIESVLPAARDQLDGEVLRTTVLARMDEQIARLKDGKAKLDAADLETKARTRIDGKIVRLAEVRAALQEILPEIE